MHPRAHRWTRRQFAQGVAASAVMLAGGKDLRAAGAPWSGHAVASSRGNSAASGALHLFRVTGPYWRDVECIPCPAPVQLVLHPAGRMLYAVHSVELWNNLPRGAVSAYRIEPATGRLALSNTQPLSLSAVFPSHADVSPDGSCLLVVSEQGGIYNVLPLDAEGLLQPPVAIRKELNPASGLNAEGAAPHQALFHPDGHTIVVADRRRTGVSLLRHEGESIRLRQTCCGPNDSRPSAIALHPGGEWVYSQHAAKGLIAVHPFVEGELMPSTQLFASGSANPSLIIVHPGGRFLISAEADQLASSAIDPGSGELQARASVRLREPLSSLHFSPDGRRLFGAEISSGAIVSLAFDVRSGRMGQVEQVARVDGATSLSFLQC